MLKLLFYNGGSEALRLSATWIHARYKVYGLLLLWLKYFVTVLQTSLWWTWAWSRPCFRISLS